MNRNTLLGRKGHRIHIKSCPDNKVHGANMAPTWILSAPDGPHDGPMNIAFRVATGGWRAGSLRLQLEAWYILQTLLAH